MAFSTVKGNEGDRCRITAHVTTVQNSDAFNQQGVLNVCVMADAFSEPELWGVRLENGEYVHVSDDEFELIPAPTAADKCFCGKKDLRGYAKGRAVDGGADHTKEACGKGLRSPISS